MAAREGNAYAGILPPLATTEFESLKADIEANGVRVPVDVDEDGNVLDGAHRLKIDPNAPRRVVKGLTDAEKEAYVFRSNLARRNLSPDQKRELLARMKETAAKLRASGKTQAECALLLGVSQPTVSVWETETSSNINANNIAKHDARVKLSEAAQERLFELVESGVSQSQVAADFGVAQTTVSAVARKVRKLREKEAEKAAKAAVGRTLQLDGFYHGDFREVAEKYLPDESVDLIFTDPPYHRKYLDLYKDTAAVGKRVLKDGGSLVCYCGQYLVPDILAVMQAQGMRLWWICAVQHTGQKARMNEYGIVVHWKPLLWFVKNTRGDKRTFVDDLVSGEREKDAHDWQQSVIEAKYFIEKLSAEGDLVFDPFCGGGTTALACRELGRRFITCDVDEDALNIAKERFSQ